MSESRETVPRSENDTEFAPSFGLRNPYSQTILSGVGPRKALITRRFSRHKLAQESVVLDGGDGARLGGYLNKSSVADSSKLAILIHGWEGSHESTYMLSLTSMLLDAGIDVFRLNLRDHGDTHHLNEGMFNSTLVDEVMDAIADLQARFAYPQFHLLGFSLGGNFCLRVAALAQDKEISLQTVVAFCPVIHAACSNAVLNQKSNMLYGRYFVRKWKRSLRKKLIHWPDYDFAEQLDSMKTLDDMNNRLVPAYTSYQDLAEYFEAYAITGERLASTIAPCHLFFAADDIIIPVSGISDLADNPKLHITVTERGGHCGYIKNWQWDSWQDERALAIIQQA